MDHDATRDGVLKKTDPPASDVTTIVAASADPIPETKASDPPQKLPCKKHQLSKTKAKSSKSLKSKKKRRDDESEESSESSTSSSSSSSSSSSEDDSNDSETESSEDSAAAKKKKKAKRAKQDAKRLKAKHSKKQKNHKKSTKLEDDDYDSDDSSEEPASKPRREKSKSGKKARRSSHKNAADELHNNDDDDDSDEIEIQEDPKSARLRALQNQLNGLGLNPQIPQLGGRKRMQVDPLFGNNPDLQKLGTEKRSKCKPAKTVKPEKKKRASKVAYKRVDQLWDQNIHNYKLTETIADDGANEWDQYIFTVRRRFDWEHKYQETLVDIKSKLLKECLQHVMAGVKGVSLVQDTPHIDPNMLFLYLEESRTYLKVLENESLNAKKKKDRKAAETKAQHLRVLIKYLDKDYAETKKTLYPMLENNMITFELLWALFKPNSVAYTTTYGDQDEARAFKIDYAMKESHFMKGTWYNIEGKYLEYDGKTFGMGSMSVQVQSFQGARRISSLECFPLQFHRNSSALRTKLIERGKKFVALEGVHYKYHKGMAYTKRKRQILKININGRVMCDPAIHRRINPNYQISTVKPKEDQDQDIIDLNEDEEEDSCNCCEDSSEDNGGEANRNTPSSSEDAPHGNKKFRVVKTPDGRTTLVEIDPNEEANAIVQKNRLADTKQGAERAFTEEELLIASPVVLGFAFSEKLWLEFTVSGISDVVFNEDAFDSLVLPENQKSIVKALVSSHAFHPSKSIDDIISGKGRGLCCVLHGPPGTGKTLTAEGIADLLKCPLYMVSAGDLGTDPRNLEKELQNILDIAHSWGAILLLDEADVFLEKRSIHDIHRNALVSIFLRLLEYFQGILFLTTNRVETFDEAFVSRIHLSLRYEELSMKARYRVWKLFIEKVKQQEGVKVGKIEEGDYNDLSRRDVNGRQIKNLVRAAQALATYEDKPLSMAHIKRVIDVAESFERDLKGGTGYSEAMRSYT